MDVIALAEAGFTATVAPLGTAVTEDQLRLLWRIHPEPVIALDGDTAGLRAAMRLIDLALPMLEAGQSLRFALMPEGLDPDDLIKAQGAGAMQTLVEAAQPMVGLLWRRETEGKVVDSPERKAAVDRSLREAIGKIKDPSIRSHYGAEIKRLREDLFGYNRRKGPSGKRWTPGPDPALPSTKSSLLAAAQGAVEDVLREAVILATLVTHPSLVEHFEGALETLDLTLPEHAAVRDALLRETAPEAIRAAAGAAALEKLFAPRHVQISPSVRNDRDADLAAQCVAEELAKLAARRGAAREIEDAMRDLDDLADEGLTWRLSQAAEAVARAGRGQAEDKTEYEVAPNGVRISRDEKGALDALIRQTGLDPDAPE